METRTYTVWSFDEAPDDLKAKILENYYDINVDHDWWDTAYMDAEQIGLKITDFDITRNECNGTLAMDLPEVVKAIKEEHGPKTDTYKLAVAYEARWAELLPAQEDETDEQYDLTEEFLTDLLAQYLTILKADYEYLTSEEAVIETLQANEYMFNKAGRIDS